MKVLVTGAFGNVGRKVVKQAVSPGHSVSIFEINTKHNRRAAAERMVSKTATGSNRSREPGESESVCGRYM